MQCLREFCKYFLKCGLLARRLLNRVHKTSQSAISEGQRRTFLKNEQGAGNQARVRLQKGYFSARVIKVYGKRVNKRKISDNSEFVWQGQ